MSYKISRSIQSKAYWLAWVQGVLIILTTLLVWFFWNEKAAISILLGGLVSILPNIYFAKTLFRYIDIQNAKKMLLKFYRNELIKLFLMGFLFVIFIRFKLVANLPYVFGFILAQLGTLFLPLFYSFERKESS